MFSTVDSKVNSVEKTSINKEPRGSSNETESHESVQSTKPTHMELSFKMLITEFIVCLIAITFTAYGALNSPSKVSQYPRAARFFSTNSHVIDWYRGQLNQALDAINRADIAFTMYYAPWDAECQYVRKEFEKVAALLHDQVHFSAVNCWHPGSQCRVHHNKISSWPVLIVYTVTSRGVLYKGPRDAQNMINFLQLIMNPLKKVNDPRDITEIWSYCDVVAISYTPLEESSRDYNVWYQTALKMREYDVNGVICFAVVTSKDIAVNLGIEETPNAHLMMWNKTLEYRSENTQWNTSSLIEWMLNNVMQSVPKIVPMWKKSFNFDRFNDGNPILIFFTPINPIYKQIPYYSLIREIAMEYNNCESNKNHHWTSELIRLHRLQRLMSHGRDIKKFCQEFRFKKSRKSKLNIDIPLQYNKYPWYSNVSRNTRNSVHNLVQPDISVGSRDMTNEEQVILPHFNLLEECSASSLPFEEKCQTFHDYLETEFLVKSPEISMLPLPEDPLSPNNLIETRIKTYCKLMHFAYEVSPPLAPVEPTEEYRSIEGLSCARNTSLYILVVDSLRNHHFAESLGVDVLNKTNFTAAVIMDTKNENQHVLSENINSKTLREFIFNFTTEQLKRSLRTHVEDAAHTHYYGSDGDVTDHVVNRTVSVIELTTRTFKKVVNTPGKLTIVSVCGGVCPWWSSRAVSEAVRLLRKCGVDTQAGRLDALRHDLPWHFSPHHYPTILVFPPDRRRKAESRSYPLDQRVTAAGIVALASRALGPLHHLRLRLALCQKTQNNAAKRSCLSEIKEHVTTVIGNNLKLWRNINEQGLKQAIFVRLTNLHNISFQLSLVNLQDLIDGSNKTTSLYKLLEQLAKHWDIDMSGLLTKANFTNHKQR